MAIKQTTSEIVPIGSIVTDGGTQARAKLDQVTVDAYASDMESGAIFPPITVFYDGDRYWLADGFHRFAAHKSRGNSGVSCDVHPGTRRDALLFAAGANATNGLRRTNQDKRRAVQMLISDDEWAKKSDRWIAEKCGVSDKTVAKLRPPTAEVPQLPRTGQDGKTRQQPTKPAVQLKPKPEPALRTTQPVIPDLDFAEDDDPPPFIPPAEPQPAKRIIPPDPDEDLESWKETQAEPEANWYEPTDEARAALAAVNALDEESRQWVIEQL